MIFFLTKLDLDNKNTIFVIKWILPNKINTNVQVKSTRGF